MAIDIKALSVGTIVKVRTTDEEQFLIPAFFIKKTDTTVELLGMPGFTQPLSEDVEIVEAYPPDSKIIVFTPAEFKELSEELKTLLDQGDIILLRSILEKFEVEEDRIADMEKRVVKWKTEPQPDTPVISVEELAEKLGPPYSVEYLHKVLNLKRIDKALTAEEIKLFSKYGEVPKCICKEVVEAHPGKNMHWQCKIHGGMTTELYEAASKDPDFEANIIKFQRRWAYDKQIDSMTDYGSGEQG